jgi:two-component system sensor histidine kinase PhoQ
LSTLSLRKRLLFAATFTLVAFLGLAGIALDRAFIASAQVSLKNQLKTQINALLTVLEIDEQGELIIPDRMPDSRLTSPSSGLYAIILDQAGDIIWRSKSSVGIPLENLQVAQPGQELFFQFTEKLNSPFYYSFGITWEVDPEKEVELTLAMINDSQNYIQFIQSHRKELVFWLGMAGILLLLMQAMSLRWGLKPLAMVTEELDLIEHAKQRKILGRYPQEIAQLSERINLFIGNERKNLTRYRNTLGDLAHSLKTPLAVIKGITEKDSKLDRENISDLVERMDKIVEYQLKRAASSQFSVMHGAVNLESVIGKLNSSLQKVYAEKNITTEISIMAESIFHGDESDLFELLGNIMDNAYKWAKSQVSLNSFVHVVTGGVHPGLTIEIHDDGPGIAEQEREAVFRRGARVDQQIPGQGIGLAVVREIVERYEGQLDIEASNLGGAMIRVSFPSK